MEKDSLNLIGNITLGLSLPNFGIMAACHYANVLETRDVLQKVKKSCLLSPKSRAMILRQYAINAKQANSAISFLMITGSIFATIGTAAKITASIQDKSHKHHKCCN